MTKERQQTGQYGEQLACEFLQAHGYRILERNFRCKLGELDIIACTTDYLVFCEVKTRSKSSGIHPSASVTAKKIKKLRQLGMLYIEKKGLHHIQPRFDVISVQLQANQPPTIEHFINAL